MPQNPLDPFAYDYEVSPFTPSQGRKGATRELQLGVHTSDLSELAIAYAIQRAGVTPETDEPNCGILLTVDTTGLTPLPDVDAHLRAGQMDFVLTEFVREPEVVDAMEAGDADKIREIIERQMEHWEGESEGAPENYVDGMLQYLGVEGGQNILPALSERDDEELIQIVRSVAAGEDLPLEVFMDAGSQFRYMDPIGISRLIRVEAIHPVRMELIESWDDEVEVDEAEGTAFAWDDVTMYGSIPDLVKLWEAPPRLPSMEPRVIQYHGTDVTRARRAFPEIAQYIRCPWPFSQEG